MTLAPTMPGNRRRTLQVLYPGYRWDPFRDVQQTIAERYQQRERTGVVRRQSRPEGEFEYLVDLPSDIDPNQVEATYHDDVPTIKVGKTNETQPRRIEIRRHNSNSSRSVAARRQGDGQRQTGTTEWQQASTTEQQMAGQTA